MLHKVQIGEEQNIAQPQAYFLKTQRPINCWVQNVFISKFKYQILRSNEYQLQCCISIRNMPLNIILINIVKRKIC